MKKILITGSHGFIGKNLVESLQSKYAIVELSREKKKNKINYIAKDISKITSKDLKSSSFNSST